MVYRTLRPDAVNALECAQGDGAALIRLERDVDRVLEIAVLERERHRAVRLGLTRLAEDVEEIPAGHVPQVQVLDLLGVVDAVQAERGPRREIDLLVPAQALDLGGEGRGTRKSENVFAIQTPVAIAIAARYGKLRKKTAAKVHFVRIEGTRDEKRKALDAINNFTSLNWEDCPDDWQATFRPAGVGVFFAWPLLTDLFPWQQGGVKAGRTWVIAPDTNMLKKRWHTLCNTDKDKRKWEDIQKINCCKESLVKYEQGGSKMSTRSSITVQVGEKVKTIYCHFDGYPSHNGRLLLENYNSQEKAEALVNLGDLSSLDESIECPPGHSYASVVPGYSVAYGRDRGEEGVEAIVRSSFSNALKMNKQQYNYFWSDGRWMVNSEVLTDEIIKADS